MTGLHSDTLAEGLVDAPVDPVGFYCSGIDLFNLLILQALSQRELHMLHAEVVALQSKLGISYKDAAHRLYMAEVEHVKKADSAAQNFAAVRERLENIISKDIVPPIHSLDKGEFDNYVWEDGRWKQKDPEQSGSL